MRNHLSRRLDSLKHQTKIDVFEIDASLPEFTIIELDSGNLIAVFNDILDQMKWAEVFFAGMEPTYFMGGPAFELGRLH